jgi:two-component system sensor histidine kinase PilS (NtrC family)
VVETSAGSRIEGRPRRRLAWLAGARLFFALAILLATFGLSISARTLAPEATTGLHATVVLACLVSGASAIWLRRARNLRRFGAVQVGLDLVIVTALVHFTGGADSIFVSLYVPVVVYGALCFDRRGAVLGAALAAFGFGGLLVAEKIGILRSFGGATSWSALVTLFGAQGGALVLAAFLASFLSRELQLADQALDRSRRDLHRLQRLHARTVESLLSGLFTTDREGRITSFNPEAERISGGRADEFLGRRVAEVLPGLAMLLDPSDERRSPRARLGYRNRRGEALHLGASASVLREADGSPAGHVVIFQDVSAVVEMERRLRRTEKLAAVGELAAAIAHEVRNPLAAISGSIQLLDAAATQDVRDGEPGRLMAIVLRETERLNRLISDFLQYARPAALRLESVAVAPLVAETLEMLAAGEGKEIRASARIDPELRVRADPAQLRQLLWNLFLNAAQAMEGRGELRVEAEVQKAPAAQDEFGEIRTASRGEGASGVEISVSDSGVGIDPEVLDRIFDPFFTTKAAGTGLGLATVHRIAEAHGGQISVESSRGAGAIFRIWLPGAEARP